MDEIQEKTSTDPLESQKETKKETISDKLISSVISLIYSKKKKVQRYLLGFLIVGFIIRLIAALNLGVLADDMIEASQSAGILSAKILSTTSHPALYFYLTDVMYGLIGYSTLASRFWPLIAGTFTILLAYLITDKLFHDKKIALLSTLFVTFSAFLVRNTFAEMSNIWLFFAFFGAYLGILYFESGKTEYIVLSGVSFGLGLLTKYNMPFYILSFLLFSVVYLKLNKKQIFTKTHIKHLILFLFIIFVFALPPLTFNYLLYKDKGILDIYFSRVIQTEATQNLYAGLGGQDSSFFDNLANPISYSQILLVYHTDLILFILGILGFGILLFKKKWIPLSFLLLFLTIPFILQSAGSYLAKHFVFMPFIFSISAAFGLNEILKKLRNKQIKIMILIIITLFLLFNLGNAYHTPNYFLDSSPTSQIKTFLGNNVQDNNLIVFDSRIYTSRGYWISMPYHTLDVQNFGPFFEQNSKLPSESLTPITVYLIECSIDDCGWGTIKNQPEFNASLDAFFAQFSKDSIVKEIKGMEYEDNKNEFISKSQGPIFYTVYKQTILLNPLLVDQTDGINSFYFTPYLYKNMQNYLYNYELHNLTDRLLNSISYFIILISVGLAFFLLGLIFYFAFKL